MCASLGVVCWHGGARRGPRPTRPHGQWKVGLALAAAAAAARGSQPAGRGRQGRLGAYVVRQGRLRRAFHVVEGDCAIVRLLDGLEGGEGERGSH